MSCRLRLSTLCAPLLLAAAASAAQACSAQPAYAWTRWRGQPGAPSEVIALEPLSGRVALGSARGAALWAPGGWPPGAAGPEVVRREGVRDLAFGERGLLLGSADGLFEGSGDASRRVAPSVREVRELAARDGVAAVASAAGLHLRLPGGERWLRAPLPAGPAERVALLPASDGGVRVVAWSAGQLWSFAARQPLRPRRRELPRLGGPPVALGSDGRGALLLVYPDALALEQARGWRVLRPVLPPGASARRHVRALGRHWLASDTGLLVAETLAGPWRRAPDPPGGRAVLHLAGDATSLWVATERGVYAARATPSEPAAGRGPAREGGRAASLGGDPPIVEVQRRALREQALEVARAARLPRGLALRGWLPLVTLDGSYDRRSGHGYDRDESFVSGQTRLLLDRDRERDRAFEVGLTLRWDLGELAYPRDSVDVSRETRALVALRDDVLDEVNQLYFERLRLLSTLARAPDDTGARADLEVRVVELTAGLDAWTGGWFSRAAEAR